MALKDLIQSLLGISTFSPPTTPYGPELGSEATHSAREALGGQLESIPFVRLRWYPPDIERAQIQATNGDLTLIGDLCESMKIDGTIRGLSGARTSVVDFPKRFYGSDDVTSVLMSKTGSDRNVYQEMIPSSEKRLMTYDGIMAGVAIGEMVPVVGRNFPVLVRRYPRNLYYLWTKNQWYYRSIVGLIPIQPGIPGANGNSWVLHIPGGRLSPWNSGHWNACGRAYINKTQTIFARQSYEMKHAHPARVGFTSTGAAEPDRKDFMTSLIRWALNAAFTLPPGWDIKLIESNGRGIDVYQHSIETYDKEIAAALCGSAVMLQGTVGFGNIDPFQIIARDLLAGTASDWDHTENTQILPAFIGGRWGTDALKNATTVETDIAEPKDRKSEAETLKSLADGIAQIVAAINDAQLATRAEGEEIIALDIREMLAKFGIPVQQGRLLEPGELQGAKLEGAGKTGGEGVTPLDPKTDPTTRSPEGSGAPPTKGSPDPEEEDED